MKSNSVIDALSALAQETRLQVFRELVRAHGLAPGEGGLAAGELAAKLAIPAPTLSFHLKELYRAGLVQSRKQGRSVIYQANLGTMRELLVYLLDDCCGGACGLPIEQTGETP